MCSIRVSARGQARSCHKIDNGFHIKTEFGIQVQPYNFKQDAVRRQVLQRDVSILTISLPAFAFNGPLGMFFKHLRHFSYALLPLGVVDLGDLGGVRERTSEASASFNSWVD